MTALSKILLSVIVGILFCNKFPPAHCLNAGQVILEPISVILKKEGPDNYYLEICLKNVYDKPVVFLSQYLPWKSSSGMTVVAVKADAFSTTLKTGPEAIDDPGIDRHTMKPGEKICGRISLTNRFPQLVKILKERDVIFFWSWKWVLDDTVAKRYGGWLLVAKTPS